MNTATVARVARAMSEADLLANVLDRARWLGVAAAHFRPARTKAGWRTAVAGDGKGFPDLVLVGPGGVLYRELKAEAGRLEPAQKRWRDALQAAGADWAVWRPSDLLAGRVDAELKTIGHVGHPHRMDLPGQ